MTHGTGSAYVMGCRCTACTAANTARVREYRKRRSEADLSDRIVTTPGPTQSDPATAPTVRGHGTGDVSSDAA